MGQQYGVCCDSGWQHFDVMASQLMQWQRRPVRQAGNSSAACCL